VVGSHSEYFGDLSHCAVRSARKQFGRLSAVGQSMADKPRTRTTACKCSLACCLMPWDPLGSMPAIHARSSSSSTLERRRSGDHLDGRGFKQLKSGACPAEMTTRSGFCRSASHTACVLAIYSAYPGPHVGRMAIRSFLRARAAGRREAIIRFTMICEDVLARIPKRRPPF